MNRLCLLTCLFLSALLGATAWAQGFGGLGTEAEGFAAPQQGRQIVFPRDHGPHPTYRIEWWYLTANLKGKDGADYGVQWTLFRSALAPGERQGWKSPQFWMGHAAVTSATSHHVAERRARGGIGQAGVTTEPFRAWIDDWSMEVDGLASASTSTEGLNRLKLKASGAEFSYALTLTADAPFIRHGDNGYSMKSQSGQASYYYSQPFYSVTGTLKLPSGPVEVTGSAWLDREWSSQPLADNQNGWDWLSLSFANGDKLMAFQLRQIDGQNFTSGTWIGADHSANALAPGAVKLTPLNKSAVRGEKATRNIPTHWRVELPERGLDIEVSALNAQAWMETSVPYWEGPVKISGSHAGRGYLEMTGY